MFHNETQEMLNYAKSHVEFRAEDGVLVWATAPHTRVNLVGKPVGSKRARYVEAEMQGKHVSVHRLVYAIANGHWPTGVIDHLNGDTHDNRIENLRDCTASSNAFRRNKLNSNNKTGVRGVCWNKERRKWSAHIGENGGVRAIGFYVEFDDAVEARRAEETKRLQSE